jgi:uncharacterized membrane protein
LVGLGYFWRNRYPTFSQALSGGGIGLFYLSFFSAFAIYDLIPVYPAILLLLLVSIGSAFLATRYNSMALAIIGVVGAFAAPFIIGVARPDVIRTGSGDRGTQLILYILIVDAGVLVLSTFRNWRWFTLLALGGSLLAFAGWHSRYGHNAGAPMSELFLTIAFLLFFGATSLFHIIWRKVAQEFDYTLMFVNAAAYLLISYGLMWHGLRGWVGGFTFLLALLYGGLAYAAFRRGAENTRISLFALAIAIILLTVAVPVQIGDKAWVTILWAAEGTILTWLSFDRRMPHFKIYSYLVFIAVAVRLLVFDTTLSPRGFSPVFNERFLAFIISIIAMYVTAYISWRNRESDDPSDFHGFLAAATFFTLWIIGAEVYQHTKVFGGISNDISLLVLLALAGTTTLYRLAWRRAPQTLDVVLILVSAVVYGVLTAFIWKDLRPWMGFVFFALALFHGLLTWDMMKRGTESSRFASFALGVAVVFFSVGLAAQWGNTRWTTIAWALELAALVWLSFKLRLPELRYYSFGIFVFMVARLLFFDTATNIRTFQPVVNQRFLAFAVGIGATYYAAYLLQRHREEMPEWRAPVSVFLIAANLLSLWILSLELWNYFGNRLTEVTSGAARTSLRNAQNLSLSALWTFYAVVLLVLGIVKRWRTVRVAALGLLAVPIIKVFVYDVFALQQGYRIIAFVGLGVLLLASAYLYQRYSKIIRGFLTNK